ncbi:hypothetical protein GCM10023189_51090 [Nibrella saemangeumensis]|uniref:Secretion system C-terminal sorting domain-containing protein n=1 Tax=Nibrella saemangeumensis TaxID=1084526 RepID=A0ABP8NL99_9BACT
MKTFVKTFALALSLSALSLTSFATGGKDNTAPTAYKAAVFASASATTLNVMIEKEMGGRVEIRLKDASGRVLHTNHLQKKDGKFWSKLNMSNLADGTYRVEVTNGVETTVKDITLSTQSPATVSRNIEMN